MTHIPIRTCVACRRRRPRHELVRIVRDAEGHVARSDRPGRGAYVCPERDCLERAARDRARIVRRALRTDAPTTEAVARAAESVSDDTPTSTPTGTATAATATSDKAK